MYWEQKHKTVCRLKVNMLKYALVWWQCRTDICALLFATKTFHSCYNVNLGCNSSAHTSLPVPGFFFFHFNFVILTKLQPPHFGLYCSLRRLSPQLLPNLFSSPSPTSTALLQCTTLGRRSVLLALSRRVNDCITNPFPISLHIMS